MSQRAHLWRRPDAKVWGTPQALSLISKLSAVSEGLVFGVLPYRSWKATFGLTEIPRHRPEPSEQGRSVFELVGDEMTTSPSRCTSPVTLMSLARRARPLGHR